MRRLSKLFLAILFLFAPVSAYAQTPQLTWERSEIHTLEIDPALVEQIANVSLVGSGESIPFTLNQDQSPEGRFLYRALIPSDFSLGEFSIRAELTNGSSTNLATVEVVQYQSQGYTPLQDPATVTTLSVTLFALIATWAAADSPARKRDEYEGDQSTLDSSDGGSMGRSAGNLQQFRRGLFSSIYLDQIRSVTTISSNRISPFLSRLISDSSYFQYSLGSLVLVFPLIGILLGGLAFQDIAGIGGISTPSTAIVIAIVILGAFDAGAGFMAALAFGFAALTSARFENAYDLRLYLGLSLLFFSSSFIANATRSLRKSRSDSDTWERLTDVLVGSLLTGWAIKCLVIALNGFAHLRLPLEKDANLIGICAGSAIAIRYLIEGYVSRKNHFYMSYISPKAVHEQSSNYRIIGWFIKGILFLFFAVSFLGITWQLWVALVILLLPSLVKTVRDRLPNSPTLFQLLPVGVPSLLIMSLFGKAYSQWLSSLDLDLATQSQNSFLLASVPALLLTFLKMFGREALPGDVRWYRRPNNVLTYRAGGVLFLFLYIGITIGVVG